MEGAEQSAPHDFLADRIACSRNTVQRRRPRVDYAPKVLVLWRGAMLKRNVLSRGGAAERGAGALR
jgi:hypothetical protein